MDTKVRLIRFLLSLVSEKTLRWANYVDLRKASMMDDELRRLLRAIADGAITDTDRVREILQAGEQAVDMERDAYMNDGFLVVEAWQAFKLGHADW